MIYDDASGKRWKYKFKEQQLMLFKNKTSAIKVKPFIFKPVQQTFIK